jgi:polyphosphate kinase
MNILAFNLKDNANSYTMQEDGTYVAKQPAEGEAKFNIHQKFFQLNAAEVMRVKLVADRVSEEAPDTSTAPNTEA